MVFNDKNVNVEKVEKMSKQYFTGLKILSFIMFFFEKYL